jgi:xylulokinase
VEGFVRRRLDPINAVGGGARSALWCQILADVFDRTIRQVQEPQLSNVRGAALQAATALGYIPFDAIGERVPIAATYRPDPAHRGLYDELFREFVNLYRQNRGIYARLNRAKGRQP